MLLVAGTRAVSGSRDTTAYIIIEANCSPSQHVILAEQLFAWAVRNPYQKFHGPSSSIAEDIQLQKLRFWSYAISATPFRGDSFPYSI